MILTVTLNAAIDVTYGVMLLEAGETHRVEEVRTQAGGKGVNVARVLHALGHEVMVTGFAGGPTGEELRADLARAGLPEALVPVAGHTRRTVTVVDDATATGFHEPGPRIAPVEWANFLATYQKLAAEADVVVLSGSLPPGVPEDGYAELIHLAPAAKSIVDTSGGPLAAALTAHPDVIKPNRYEALSATGIYRTGAAAARLRERGARAVIASLDQDGMLALTPDGDWTARLEIPLEGNPTGAGDACVAALAAGLADGTPWRELLVEAVALAAAAVLRPVAGEVDLPAYRRLRSEVLMEEPHARADL
jgi:tagatose 6-phosphate kinase